MTLYIFLEGGLDYISLSEHDFLWNALKENWLDWMAWLWQQNPVFESSLYLVSGHRSTSIQDRKKSFHLTVKFSVLRQVWLKSLRETLSWLWYSLILILMPHFLPTLAKETFARRVEIAILFCILPSVRIDTQILILAISNVPVLGSVLKLKVWYLH